MENHLRGEVSMHEEETRQGQKVLTDEQRSAVMNLRRKVKGAYAELWLALRELDKLEHLR